MNIPAENHHHSEREHKKPLRQLAQIDVECFFNSEITSRVLGVGKSKEFSSSSLRLAAFGVQKKTSEMKRVQQSRGEWNRRGNVQLCLVCSSSSCLSIINILIHFPKRRRKESLFQRRAQVTWRRF